VGEQHAWSIRRGEGLPDPLVVALRGGSEPALARLAEECARDLLPQLRSRLGRRSRLGLEAEDVLQDAFLRAIVRLQDFHGETRREFKTWLYRIAINRLFDAFRAARREREREGRVVFTDLSSVGGPEASTTSGGRSEAAAAQTHTAGGQSLSSGSSESGEREELLIGAHWVGGAERGQREALVLRDLLSLSWESLGFITGRTPEGTKSLYYRARRAARALPKAEAGQCDSQPGAERQGFGGTRELRSGS
jgi:RNA polymerase sigma factor (sigma-70 family)